MKWYLGIDVSKGYADFALVSELLIQVKKLFNWMIRGQAMNN